MNFETIKSNYDKGLWNIQLVRMAVQKGLITKEEYNQITGCIYPNIR